MYFSEWRKLQKNKGMFNISESYVAEGFSTKQFEEIIHNFLYYLKRKLRLSVLPEIEFVDSPKFAKKIAAFGRIKNNKITIHIGDRHIMDILRTLTHEIIHYNQHSHGIHGSGKAGSPTEDQANRLAGSIIRKFGEENPHLFTLSSVTESKRKRKKKLIDIDYEHLPTEMA